MARKGQIEAVEHIQMRARADLRDRLLWFYREIAMLDPVADHVDSGCLRLKSSLIELRIELVEDSAIDPMVDPTVNPMARRMTLRIPCLDVAADLLSEHKIEFAFISGISWTDRRLVVHDPAGNRVEFRRKWPLL